MPDLRAVGRFLELPSQRRRAFLSAFAVVLAIRAGLGVASFKRVRSAARTVAQPPDGLIPADGQAERIAWAVRSAARFVPGASCLTQALAAELLLARAGHEAQIRLGVAKDQQGRIEAHAWVESSGRVLLGDEDLYRYARLEPPLTLPAHRRL